ncbi:MAG: hypothetical protein H5T49_03525 [Hadesarchaea archaeon]|nr:hypothetical protein [Hadesarchaea archaeon]
MGEAVNSRVVKTVCRICSGECGLDVHTESGKIVKVEGMKEHPVNRGEICPKAAINFLFRRFTDVLGKTCLCHHGE